MFKYMYIDESGDLGSYEKGSKFLVIAALMVNNPRDLNRIIKNMRRHKFRKQLRKVSEIKANKSKDEIRRYMLSKLNSISDMKVCYIVLEKKRLYSEYLKKDKNKLYNFVAGKVATHLSIDHNTDIEIRIDKSKGKQLLQQDFNNYFEKLLKQKNKLRKIDIHHSLSHNWSGLQFADLLSWACFQRFEYNDSSYIDIIDIGKQEFYSPW